MFARKHQDVCSKTSGHLPPNFLMFSPNFKTQDRCKTYPDKSNLLNRHFSRLSTICQGVILLPTTSIPRSRNRCRSQPKQVSPEPQQTSPKPKQVSPGATADIPGGDELYLAAGERSVTRGKQHLHVSSPKGANSIREREGERKAPSIVRCPLSIVHCSRRSPPSGTHTPVDFLSAGYAHSVRSPAVKYGWPAPRTFCRQKPRVLL